MRLQLDGAADHVQRRVVIEAPVNIGIAEIVQDRCILRLQGKCGLEIGFRFRPAIGLFQRRAARIDDAPVLTACSGIFGDDLAEQALGFVIPVERAEEIGQLDLEAAVRGMGERFARDGEGFLVAPFPAQGPGHLAACRGIEFRLFRDARENGNRLLAPPGIVQRLAPERPGNLQVGVEREGEHEIDAGEIVIGLHHQRRCRHIDGKGRTFTRGQARRLDLATGHDIGAKAIKAGILADLVTKGLQDFQRTVALSIGDQ